MNCDFTQLPNGKYWCQTPGCDDKQRRLVSALGKRTCRADRDPRREAERELRALIGSMDDARPWPDILATLDRCFGGCKKMDERTGHCNLRGESCTQRTNWLTFVLFNDCEYTKEAT